MRSFKSLFEGWSDQDKEQQDFIAKKMKSASKRDKDVIDRLQQLVPDSAVVPDGTNDYAPVLIVRDGQSWTNSDVVKRLDRGEHACHENCSELWGSKAYPRDEYAIATGYYLSSKREGLWRSHSWLVRKRDHKIIETTGNKAELYFGAILDDEHSAEFARSGGPISS